MDETKTFKFIEVVQGYEEVWNICSNTYKNTKQRDLMWNEIGKQFCITGESAKSFFKTLRDKYRRQKERENAENRSGAGSYRKEQWVFFNHLKFLDAASRKRRVTNSVMWEVESNFKENDGIITEDFTLSSPDTLSVSLLTSPDSQLSKNDISSPVPITTVPPLQTTSLNASRGNKSRTVEEIFETASNKLLSCLKPIQPGGSTVQKYHSAVVEFIVETLGKLSKEDANSFEKELMKVATRFRYDY